MLSARALNLQRITASSSSRTFATAVADAASGVRVAAVDFGQPTSAVTVLVKAGSRFQNKEGVANVLKNFAFKSTAKRSAIGTVREAELYGGLLSASLGREHLALTAEFLRGDEAFFVDVLSSFVTSARFTRHELEEYVKPLVESDAEAVASNPATRALEAAHALAFRSGLGSSLFAPAHNDINVADIKAFASSAFAKGNVAVIGTNIDSSTLNKLVEQSFTAATAAEGSTAAPASKYFGGETRLEGSGGPQTLFIGFGAEGAPSAELAALAAHLSTQPSVKWSKSLSPIATAIPEGAQVQSVYLPYSDASLFGLLVQAESVGGVKEAAKVAVEALRNAAKGLKEEEVKGAVARAKFAAASGVESREGLVNVLGAKIFAGSEVSVESTLSAFDKVNAASFSKAVSSLISAKPTLVTVGDSLNLPHTDELGF
ncbi:LuxS/MPP-like metallohydrolase [Macrolepiota fuliginosa MF-IS2]|uniref:Cytochrome b-c1 complex subunit 2, mitochondrial n=1 Tax=Macrolepiota fuliginosa MF-IS2 TaxID=1400762 RepID=A0A9P6C0Q8_9AGAR|nr:LuxS/MPP-like metallohydrolase [Macrolepiota fuliginosa MF-IS2]